MTTAQQLLNNVISYKKSATSSKNMINNQLPFYRVYLGLSDYPNQSNLSAQNIYPNVNSIAFFSQTIKPDLFFILALLLGSNAEAYRLMQTMCSNPPNAIQWVDIVKYLAEVKGFYFVNVEDTNFISFAQSFRQKSIKFLIFSKRKNSLIPNQVVSLPSYLDHAAIIHPSSMNLNNWTMEWLEQYALQSFVGQIGASNISYSDFQI